MRFLASLGMTRQGKQRLHGIAPESGLLIVDTPEGRGREPGERASSPQRDANPDATIPFAGEYPPVI